MLCFCGEMGAGSGVSALLELRLDHLETVPRMALASYGLSPDQSRSPVKSEGNRAYQWAVGPRAGPTPRLVHVYSPLSGAVNLVCNIVEESTLRSFFLTVI